MKKRKILGVRCNVIGPHMFEGVECIVNICGIDYQIWNSSLELTDEAPKRPYVWVICSYYDKLKQNFLVGINANEGYQNIRAKESSLVFA